MIRRVGSATARFAKPLRAQTYNIARQGQERGEGAKFTCSLVIINQHHDSAGAHFLNKKFWPAWMARYARG